MDSSVVEFADQLTYLEWNLWNSILPTHLLFPNKNQSKLSLDLSANLSLKEETHPLKLMAKHFNLIDIWIKQLILSESDPEKRHRLIKKLIHCANVHF